MEQSRPLKALHDIKVDDVDTIVAFEGFEDGLVSGEVREFDEGGEGIVGL